MDLKKTLQDAFYVSVGLGVIGFQKAQVRRVELEKQLKEQFGQLDEQRDVLRKQLDEQLDGVRAGLDELVKRSRDAADELRGEIRGRFGAAA